MSHDAEAEDPAAADDPAEADDRIAESPAPVTPPPADDADGVDAKHRQVALDLLVSGKASQEVLKQAVELVRQRREDGKEALLLPVLVGLGILSDDEAEAALERVESGASAVSDAAQAGGQDWWESDRGAVSDGEAGWWESGSGSADPEPAESESADPADPAEPAEDSEAPPAAPESADDAESPPAAPESADDAESPPAASAESGSTEDAESPPLAAQAAVAPPQAPGSSGRAREPRSPSTSARARFERGEKGPGARIAGAMGLVTLGLLALWTFRAAPAPQAASAPPTTETPGAEPRPTLVTLPQSDQVLGELAAAGRFDLAIELIETCTPELRELGQDVFPAQLELFERGRSLQAELDAALAAGPESRRLLELILQSENFEFDSDLQALGFVQLFQARAMQLLGEQAYQDLVVFGMPADPEQAGGAEEDDDEVELLRREQLAIETRGDAARRERFEAEAAAAARVVEAARERIVQRQAETSARLKAEAERALADVRPVSVPPWRGEPSWSGRVVGYESDGFVLQGPRARRAFTWVDAPATTACDVLDRGVADDDPAGLYRVLRRALTGGLFDRAEGYLTRLKALAPKRPLPDLEELRPLGSLFHAAGTASVDSLDVLYAFDEPVERQDWLDVGPAHVEQREGELRMRPFLQLGLSYARVAHAGVFAEVECTVAPAFVSSRVIVAFGDHVVRCGSDGARLSPWGSEAEEGAAEGPPVDMARPFQVALAAEGGAIQVQVRQGDQLLLDDVVPGPAADGFFLMLGAQGGEARLAQVRLRGRPQEAWFERARDALPFALERALEAWELRHDPRSGARDALPPAFAETSAEDAIGLEGVPAAAQADVKAARRWLGLRDYGTAARYLRQAVSKGRGSYWAAEYLLALCELEEAPHGDNLEGERLRLEQALEGIEDFYEALTARSSLHLQEGNLLAAQADAQRALELRPDYAPAHLALAWLRVQAGDLAGASDSAALARELSPDLETGREVAQIQALRAGPSWNEPSRHESEHYVVWTDLPGRGEGFLRELEALRELAPRVLPTLRPRAGARQRKGEVFVFARPEDFYRYAYRTLGQRGENLAGVFSPRSGQLLLFESREGPEQTSLVLRHEATHQWVHSLGLALPYWVNEAIATYLAGVRERHRGGFATQDWDEQEIEVLLQEEARWTPLFELMTMSPAEFYGGYTYLKYAQAWSFVHYCMEGGDSTLRDAFLDYLGRHSRGRAGDTSGLLGVKLEHIYAETFHQLDMRRVQERWRDHVKIRLAGVLRDR